MVQKERKWSMSNVLSQPKELTNVAVQEDDLRTNFTVCVVQNTSSIHSILYTFPFILPPKTHFHFCFFFPLSCYIHVRHSEKKFYHC